MTLAFLGLLFFRLVADCKEVDFGFGAPLPFEKVGGVFEKGLDLSPLLLANVDLPTLPRIAADSVPLMIGLLLRGFRFTISHSPCNGPVSSSVNYFSGILADSVDTASFCITAAASACAAPSPPSVG